MNETRFDGISRRLAAATSRRQALKVVGGGLAGGLLAGGVASRSWSASAQEATNPFVDIPVEGVDSAGEVVFAGTLDIRKFVASKRKLVALGKISGELTTKNGKTKTVKRAVRVPVTAINGVALAGGDAAAGRVEARQVACDILNLTLGPLDLNLLGLRVQLNQVDLDITAVPGAGLLGDLLCAVANLLSPLGALARIAELLNRILDFFEGLIP